MKGQLLRTFIQRVWNEKDSSALHAFITADYTVRLDAGDPWEGRTLDHAEFRTRLSFSFGSFPDLHFDLQTALEDEQAVAVTWILTGTHLGNIGDLPPTGRSIRTTGMTVYHFRGDRICGHSQVFDRRTVASQLGFGAPPGRAAAL